MKQTSSGTRSAIRKNVAADLKSINVEASYQGQPTLEDYISSKISEHHSRLMANNCRADRDHCEEVAHKCEIRAEAQSGLESCKQSSNPYAMDEKARAETAGKKNLRSDDHCHKQQDSQDGQEDEHSFGDHGNVAIGGDDHVYDYPEEPTEKAQAGFGQNTEHEIDEHEPVSMTTTTRTQPHNFGQTQQTDSDTTRIHNQTLQLKSLEESSPKKIHQQETLQGLNRNSYLVSRYHHLKQCKPRISAQTIKFASDRIEPPQCLLDILDALFSLVHGLFTPLEDTYFNELHRDYANYRKYLRHGDELTSVLANLKSTLENEGLPTRNFVMADKALCRYKKTVKRIEPRSYVDPCNEIYKYVYYFLEYFNLMRVSFSDKETSARTSAQT